VRAALAAVTAERNGRTPAFGPAAESVNGLAGLESTSIRDTEKEERDTDTDDTDPRLWLRI
jgi:hypothetical protein